MNAIAAIPTKYSGVQFRSRLEARWAALFDLCGFRWQYEPFDCQGYIPDFLINERMLVEIKPIVWSPLAPASALALSEAQRKLEVAFEDRRYPFLAVLGVGVYEYAPGGALSGKAADRDFDDQVWQWRDLTLDYWPSENEISFLAQPILGSHPNPEPLPDERYFDRLWREAGNRVQWRGVGARP